MSKGKNKSISFLSKLIIDKELITGDINIANAFNKYFCTIGSDLSNHFIQNEHYKQYLKGNFENTMFLNPVIEEEVKMKLIN